MPINTVNDISPRIQYTAAGGQTVFSIPYLFYANTDISVYLATSSATFPNDASNTVGGLKLTLTTDYTVTGAGLANPAPGTHFITLVAPATAGNIVTIVRDMPEDRTNYYIAGGAFTADQVNTDFNMDVMMNQQNEMHIDTLTPHYQDSAYNLARADGWLQQLPPGYSWRKNAANTYIEAFIASSASPPVVPTSVTELAMTITQAAHGLIAGNVVRLNVANFITAQADNATNAEAVGIVTSVPTVNTFVLQVGGFITAGLVGLVAGTTYYLDPAVAGGLTSTKPTTVTQVVKPLLVAMGASSGIWINLLGVVL